MPKLPKINLSKKNKIILAGIGGLLLVTMVILFMVSRGQDGSSQPTVTLEYWGVFDDERVMGEIIDQYREIMPHVQINYTQKDFATYEDDLRNALAGGNPPDIFSLSNGLVSKFRYSIAPLPETETGLIEEYFDVVEQDVVIDEQIYGLPYSVDSLALFYNKDLLEKAGISNPPRTWDEFNDAIQSLTVLNPTGGFLQSGVALGGSKKSVNRATDILGFFMMQQGTTITDRETERVILLEDSESLLGERVGEPGRKGLEEYLSYSQPTESVYSWNEDQYYSFDRFAQEKCAMMLSYAYSIATVRENNPRMKFGVVPAPQPKNATKKIAYANYWVETVPLETENYKEAWEFIAWATSKDTVKLYSSLTNKPVSRRDLVNEQLNDADLGAFAEQNIYAESWYQYDPTEVEMILDTMLQEILSGVKDTETALTEASTKIQALLDEGRRVKSIFQEREEIELKEQELKDKEAKSKAAK
ncbi:ABC transporter substrate-binding protein [Patescibacteria group bacterium]